MHRQSICCRLAMAGCLLVHGCAALSKEECLSTDWQTSGYEDGTRCRPTQRIGRHREDCAQHGIAPDREAYMAGHRQGIRQYCTPDRGFALGQSGKRYNGICPSDVEADFRAAHAKGRAVYLLEKELDHLQAEEDMAWLRPCIAHKSSAD